MSLPKPYYSEPGITIYCGDNRDILPHLEVSDICVTDPPYGISWQSNWNAKEKHFGKIVGDGEVKTSWIYDLQSENVYCFTRWDVMQQFVDAFNQSPVLRVKDVLVWDKLSHGAGDLNSWAPTYEMIIFACTQSPKLLGTRPQNVLRHWRVDGGATGVSSGRLLSHPAEKPVPLLTDIIQKHLGTVVDPFMGSGSVLRACKDLGRKVVGIEIDEKWCDLAVKRLQQEVFDFK